MTESRKPPAPDRIPKAVSLKARVAMLERIAAEQRQPSADAFETATEVVMAEVET